MMKIMMMAQLPARVIQIRRIRNLGPPRRGLNNLRGGFRGFRCAPPTAIHGQPRCGFSRGSSDSASQNHFRPVAGSGPGFGRQQRRTGRNEPRITNNE